jgi:micrococcal nuclease
MHNTPRTYSLLFIILLLLPFLALAADSPWSGLVVAITDGDTIKVMHDGKPEKIRLYGIDTPERKQAFGSRAKQFTSDQVFKQTVNVVPYVQDRYRRTIAMVYLQDASESLNESVVKNGCGWVYRKYCVADFCSDLLELEKSARDR